MRRLAVQDRGDTYNSNRDYQTIHEEHGRRISTSEAEVVLFGTADEGNSPLVGCGGFLSSPDNQEIRITLVVGDRRSTKTLGIGPEWTRFGLLVEDEEGDSLELQLDWQEGKVLDIWGVAGGRLELPDHLQGKTAGELSLSHLMPETFYLDHSLPIALQMTAPAECWSEGAVVYLKKCSYCGRLLPLDPARLGALSFHKHNAKRTNHQNECRACKKWRINDTFNPMRTTDQLHESSVITRERKILLREPEILQGIKERTGAGLKSQVWERFDRRCFFCGVEVSLRGFQLDHTRPLAYLWPIDEYATCLCPEHNNEKGDKFPVDFYSASQLARLADITGLSLGELSVRDVNEAELSRIVAELSTFAANWDARTFASVARKVLEVRPQTNLFEILREIDPDGLADLQERLARRPASSLEDR